jgi:hypothetical protein
MYGAPTISSSHTFPETKCSIEYDKTEFTANEQIIREPIQSKHSGRGIKMTFKSE